MSEMIKGCYVAFDRDISEEAAEPILNAIRMLRHVADVETVNSVSADWYAKVQAKLELERKLFEVLR